MAHTPTKTVKKSLKKNQQRSAHITIVYGYALFFAALLFTSVTLYTMGQVLFAALFNHAMIIAIMIGSAAALVIPLFIAYITGSYATHAPSRQLHHYNGVLFGVLGFWLSLVITLGDWLLFSSPMTQEWFFNIGIRLLPAIITIVIVAMLGLLYARQTKHQQSLMTFKPFVMTLISVIVLLFIMNVYGYIFNPYDNVAVNTDVMMIIITLAPAALFAAGALFGYWRARKAGGSRMEGVVKGIIAVTFLVLAFTVAQQLISLIPNATLNGGVMSSLYSLIISIAVWVSYMVISPEYK